MALLTTTIGAYPKPDYVPTLDWFRAESTNLVSPSKLIEEYLQTQVDDLSAILDRGEQRGYLPSCGTRLYLPFDMYGAWGSSLP